jgi:hypothetical protein
MAAPTATGRAAACHVCGTPIPPSDVDPDSARGDAMELIDGFELHHR